MSTRISERRIRNLTRLVGSMIVVFLLVAIALPALAAGGSKVSGVVKRGNFRTFATGVDRGYQITGHARMTRTGDEKTIVSVHVTGLAVGTAYGSHVHNKACNDANGGGHYQNIVGGGVNAVNEIWPLFTTNEAGIGNGNAKNYFRARPEARSVVIHDTDGARIACADLLP